MQSIVLNQSAKTFHTLFFFLLKVLSVLLIFSNAHAVTSELSGRVLCAGSPVKGAAVTLYFASADKPIQLTQGKALDDGSFRFNYTPPSTEGVYYLIAKGGSIKNSAGQDPGDALVLMTLIGRHFPDSVTINELTTVASAFTASRFFQGDALSGNLLGLKIASDNVQHFADLKTGEWGKTVVDPANLTQTTTLAKLNTLSSLISAFATKASANWRERFFKATTSSNGLKPANTLEALLNCARTPWNNAKDLYNLFDETYPQPTDGNPRAAPFIPYLAYVPEDFALMLYFSGGGYFAGGKFCFDAEGNLWSGQNWMPGSQSGVNQNIGGGVCKFSPNGLPLSPPVYGFRGMGINGIGWGTGVTRDKVWVSSFNGKIGVMDFNGHPLAEATDFPFKEKIGGLMGVGVALNGDVWIADESNNQLLYFPNGEIKKGRIVKVKGLNGPFGIAIDNNNRVWVSNSLANTVVRFPAEDPSKVDSFTVGGGARGVALDSKGNLWVASNVSPGFPRPQVPPGLSIMEQFKFLSSFMQEIQAAHIDLITGVVNMIRPDGTQPSASGFDGKSKINVPWGVSIDGNDDVWVANLFGKSVVLLAGAEPQGHAPGVKTGDLIHEFTSGSMQMLTDVAVDPAGNVWVANNWNNLDAVTAKNPTSRLSTFGGGTGFTVIYGVAAPTIPPLLGQVRKG